MCIISDLVHNAVLEVGRDHSLERVSEGDAVLGKGLRGDIDHKNAHEEKDDRTKSHRLLPEMCGYPPGSCKISVISEPSPPQKVHKQGN